VNPPSPGGYGGRRSEKYGNKAGDRIYDKRLSPFPRGDARRAEGVKRVKSEEGKVKREE
jgi:hypothetical protein